MARGNPLASQCVVHVFDRHGFAGQPFLTANYIRASIRSMLMQRFSNLLPLRGPLQKLVFLLFFQYNGERH